MTTDLDDESPDAGGPLAGLKVVELGMWVAAPAAAAMLADWGADVVKIEPLDGDPVRGWTPVHGDDGPERSNPVFDLDNRGKQSVAVNLADPAGRDIALRLVGQADVVVTNMRSRALVKLGLSYETVRELNPGLVYCHITAFGLEPENENRASFDIGAFWSSTGLAASLSPPGQAPAVQRPGIGDHTTAVAAVAGICAALVRRERTGRGEHVVTSLYRAGGYTMGTDLSCIANDTPVTHADRLHPLNPLLNSYPTQDGEWVWLLLLQSDLQWPALCAALGLSQLRSDERFGTLVDRSKNAPDLVRIIDAATGAMPLSELATALDRHGVWWAKVNSLESVLEDPLARSTGLLTEVPSEGPAGVQTIAGPVDFSGSPWRIRTEPPETGQDTEAVLLELGFTWTEMADLKQQGAIG